MKIPVLTYHSLDIHGNDYGNNDLVALASDLRTITRAGFRIAPLHALVSAWLRDSASLDGARLVALTCDDGTDFDYFDLPHPTAGVQRSVANLMRDFQRENPAAQPTLHITSFPIVSPLARDRLDTTCMIGTKWWNDSWWPDAVASGLMGIGNHSWDHNHGTLEGHAVPGLPRGSFAVVDSEAAADYEIRQASAYLRRQVPNEAAALFAYPYSEANDFLRRDYLPRVGPRIGLDAAFGSIDADYWTATSDRWYVPRFASRQAWKSPEGLQRILDRAR
jgi:hypothetical protein